MQDDREARERARRETKRERARRKHADYGDGANDGTAAEAAADAAAAEAAAEDAEDDDFVIDAHDRAAGGEGVIFRRRLDDLPPGPLGQRKRSILRDTR